MLDMVERDIRVALHSEKRKKSTSSIEGKQPVVMKKNINKLKLYTNELNHISESNLKNCFRNPGKRGFGSQDHSAVMKAFSPRDRLTQAQVIAAQLEQSPEVRRKKVSINDQSMDYGY